MDVSRPITSVIPGLPGRVLGVLGRTDTPLTGRAIAKAMTPPASQAGVAKVLDAFVRDGIVLRTEAGASAQYTLNREHIAAPFVEGLAELRSTFIERLTAAVDDLRPPPLSAYLYGSAARGDGDPDSDIDIAIVISDEIEDVETWDAATSELRRRVHAMTGNDASVVEYRLRELFGKHDDWAVATLSRDGIRVGGATIDDLRRRWQALDMRSRQAAVIAHAHLLVDSPAEAVEPLLRARDAYLKLGDRYGEARILADLGDAYKQLRRWEDAAASFVDAADAFRAVGDDKQEADAIARRALILVETHRPHDAIDQFQRALTVGRDAPDEWRARVHVGLAMALAGIGDSESARREVERAISLLRAAGEVGQEAIALLRLATIVQGFDTEAAVDAARRAHSLFEDISDDAGVADSLRVMGLLHAERREYDESRRLFAEALTRSRRAGDAWGEALALWFLGEVRREAGDLTASVEPLRSAADLFHAQDLADAEANVWDSLGEVHAAQGDTDEALVAYRHALDAYRRAGDTTRATAAFDALERLRAQRIGRTAS